MERSSEPESSRAPSWVLALRACMHCVVQVHTGEKHTLRQLLSWPRARHRCSIVHADDEVVVHAVSSRRPEMVPVARRGWLG